MTRPLRLAHCADIHWSEKLSLGGELVLAPESGLNVRLADVSRCVDAFTDAAAAHEVDVCIVAGDVFDRARPTPNEERAAIASLERMRAHTGAPVIVIPGNHEHPGVERDATGLTCLRGRPGIYVAEEPGYYDLYSDRAHPLRWTPLAKGEPRDPIEAIGRGGLYHLARIFVLPWTGRSSLLGDEDLAGLTAEQLTGLVSQRVQALAARMRELRAPGVPNVLVFHGTIEGCEVNEQPQSLQREIGMRAVDLEGFNLVCLGHIHKHQHIRGCGETVAFYSGSIDRANVGEEKEPKGGLLYRLSPGLVEATFAPTPARPYRTIPVDRILAGEVIQDDGRTVYRVSGRIAPEQAAELRARLDGMAVRHLVRDVEVTRAYVARDGAMEGLTEEALVRRRLEARDVPPEQMGPYLELHNRVVARS